MAGGGAPSLSVVLPAWNEADAIGSTLRALLTELAALREDGRLSDFEVVVVDDGSTDATAPVARAAGPSVRVLAHGRNRGLGAAVRTGIDAAACDLVLYTDADLPAHPDRIGVALDHLGRRPGVVCAHRADRRADGPRRLLYSVAYNRLVRRVLGVRVPDVNFAFKLLPTPAARELGLRSEGSFIDAELLARAGAAGLEITSFAVEYHPRTAGRSTLSSVPVILDILREMRALGPDLRADSGRA